MYIATLNYIGYMYLNLGQTEIILNYLSNSGHLHFCRVLLCIPYIYIRKLVQLHSSTKTVSAYLECVIIFVWSVQCSNCSKLFKAFPRASLKIHVYIYTVIMGVLISSFFIIEEVHWSTFNSYVLICTAISLHIKDNW